MFSIILQIIAGVALTLILLFVLGTWLNAAMKRDKHKHSE